MSEEAAPAFQESFTSAALDGARIACVTAQILTAGDEQLSRETKEAVIDYLDQARQWLNEARAALGYESTSVHIVTASAGGIIRPS